MTSGFSALLKRLCLALAAVAIAVALTLGLSAVSLELKRIGAPFLFLTAVLVSSWAGRYAGGFASILFAFIVGPFLGMHPDFSATGYYRLALLLPVSICVSWIESYRRQIEFKLRRRVDEKTAELNAAIERLKMEVQDRKDAEAEIRRLNQLLEQRVDERTRQLRFSNQELESFSYSVSHDLRAPLRSIDGFSRLLLERCAAQLDDQQRDMFQRILAAISRMNDLIEGLLNLSQLTRESMKFETVDLSRLATAIASELRSAQPESAAQVLVEPGLTAECDQRLAEVLLQNLIGNAWKFSSRSPSPCIEFGATSISGERVFFVRDNGAGFDPAYKSKLFMPFQRLHGQDEFPGSGIGLATAARIIHRHNGWISAESQPGKGATFFFTFFSPADYRPDEPKPPEPRRESASSSSTQSTFM